MAYNFLRAVYGRVNRGECNIYDWGLQHSEGSSSSEALPN